MQPNLHKRVIDDKGREWSVMIVGQPGGNCWHAHGSCRLKGGYYTSASTRHRMASPEDAETELIELINRAA